MYITMHVYIKISEISSHTEFRLPLKINAMNVKRRYCLGVGISRRGEDTYRE
jgi:hypothetical protein